MRHYYRKRREWDHREFAEKHIQEANEFSRLVGGTDKLVKDFFFSLNDATLNNIFAQYGEIFGSNAKSYAQKSYTEWKSGKRQMSGVVAKRLFSFLPAYMDAKLKFNIAENIWKRYLPSSRLDLAIGIQTPISDIQERVKLHLQRNASEHHIPNAITESFEWLAQNDIRLLEEMLNYFINCDIQRAFVNIGNLVPIIQSKAQNGNFNEADCSFAIQNHSVYIRIESKLKNSIVEGGNFADNVSNSKTMYYICIAIVLFLLYNLLF